MYSLYRAWLMRDAVAAASLTTPPDIIINVGNATTPDETRPYSHQFIAHRNLVSMHSGYLKALIQNEPPVNTSQSNSHLQTISVPSITPDTFAPLLSFMYTGYLDVNNENIYSILLATHLLHMPRALDLCRAYLVQNQTEIQRHSEIFRQNLEIDFRNQTIPIPNRNIIKPIPSKKAHDFTNTLWNPINVPPLLLHTSPNGPFQSVLPEKLQIVPEPEKYIDVEHKSPLPSTSKNEERNTPPSSVSPCPSTTSCTSDDRTVNIVKSPLRKTKRKEPPKTVKTVVDVACCDGPVRFHRVLNESYGLELEDLINSEDSIQEQEKKDQEQEYLRNYPKTQFLKTKSEKRFKDFMHQQMLNSKSYKKKVDKGVIQMRKVVEKDVSEQNENSSEATTEAEDKIYTCLYCNHTFKSQYCYQKHTRRHINPVDVEVSKSNTPTSNTNNKNLVIMRKVVSTTKVDEKDNVKREVRLLDMNVQYYPCKTCGSKFPSYYFVHKHRKMCHSNEEAVENENSNSSHSNSAKS